MSFSLRRLGSVLFAIGLTGPVMAQNNLPGLEDVQAKYMVCLLECETKYASCFKSNPISLSDTRHLLDKARLAKLQVKEIQSVYLCLGAKGQCYAECKAPFGRN